MKWYFFASRRLVENLLHKKNPKHALHASYLNRGGYGRYMKIYKKKQFAEQLRLKMTQLYMKKVLTVIALFCSLSTAAQKQDIKLSVTGALPKDSTVAIILPMDQYRIIQNVIEKGMPLGRRKLVLQMLEANKKIVHYPKKKK